MIRKQPKGKSIAEVNPELAKEWHPTKNGSLTAFDVTEGSNKKVWWKCDKGEDHEWPSWLYNRSKGKGCSICAGSTVVKSNSLATLNPELAKEWRPTKNGGLTPNDVTAGSDKKVWWKCDKGEDLEWPSWLYNRSKGNGCPYCTLTPQSKQELTITFELIQLFDINPKGFKTMVKGKMWTIDIYLPELNLGIEFDGNYWHKGKRGLDKLKTERLEGEGFKIMRIREDLKTITDIDIVFKKPFNAKEITNNILIHIMEIYSLDAKKVQKIEKYLMKKEIQNEKGLDAYIDMILTEKAEKNKFTLSCIFPNLSIISSNSIFQYSQPLASISF